MRLQGRSDCGEQLTNDFVPHLRKGLWICEGK
jgi:hypothetical protein